MLAHEREHVRARDPLLLAAASLACALAPWNPALWWQRRRLRDAVELDCDRRTLRRAAGGALDHASDPVPGAAVGAYGRLLLDVAARAPRAVASGLALAPRHNTLRRRIAVMTAPRSPRSLAPASAAEAALLVLLAATVPRPAPAAQAHDPFGIPARSVTAAGPSPANGVAGPRLATLDGRVVGSLGPGIVVSGSRLTLLRPPAAVAPFGARALLVTRPVTITAATPAAIAAADTTPVDTTRRAGDRAYRAVVRDSAGTVELTPLDSQARPSGPAVVRHVVRMAERSGAAGVLDSVFVVVDGHALHNYLRSFGSLPPDSIATVRVSPGKYVAMHDSAGRRVRGPEVDLPIVQITTKRGAAQP